MNSIWMIASNTLRQTVRQRLFYNVVLFGLALVLLAMVVSNLTFGRPDRVVRTIGLSGVSLAVCLMSLLVGVSLVHQEIDKKTLFVLLTRPLERWQYVAGRYLGLLVAITLMTAGLSVVFVITLAYSGGDPSVKDLVALCMSIPEGAVIGAVGVVLSCFSTPTVGTGLGLGIWMIGASTDDLVRLTTDESGPNPAAVLVSYLFPAMARFDFREAVVYRLSMPPADVMSSAVYGAVYAGTLVALASIILSRREMV